MTPLSACSRPVAGWSLPTSRYPAVWDGWFVYPNTPLLRVNVVLAEFTTKPPCKPKPNRPPSDAALAIASGIGDLYTETVIDLEVYQRHIDQQNRGL